MSSSDDTGCAPMSAQGWHKYEITAFANPPASMQKDTQPTFNGYGSPNTCTGAFEPLSGKSRLWDSEQQAGELLRIAREKADAIERDAYAKGFQQGEKDGFEYGQKKVAKVVDKIEALVVEMSQVEKRLVDQGEKALLDIVFAVSRKIVQTQTAIDGDAVKNAVMNAIGYAVDKSRLTVRINPEDNETIAGIRPEVFKRFQQVSQISIVTDPSINRGGCLVESLHGNVDVTIESQLDKIRDAIASVYRQKERA